ncbi:MAG: ATP synthase F1 subunit gamma [Candidatus Pacebacteria bacterium]|nr:ATP synthase F1 subunit gamma [Candidatus Paceibacterota bacterium]
MAGTKEIKRRIKSVKNTKKITKAMELVAASKMRRAVAQATSSRLYSGYSWELLTSLSNKLEEITHPFFVDRTEGRTLIVLITSNGSLCGGYNSQIIKKVLSMLKIQADPAMVDIVSVGKKGDEAMRRVKQNVLAAFTDLPAVLRLSDVAPLSTLLINEFKSEKYKEVYVAYTDFISALTQKPKIRKLLPISKDDMTEIVHTAKNENQKIDLTPTGESPYLFEGNMDELIESLAEKLTRMQIYQMLLESNASEQSSRMMAMKNASEASGEMIDDLTLVFNKARQSNITREISEISAGMASIG